MSAKTANPDTVPSLSDIADHIDQGGLGQARLNAPLAPFSWFKVGGQADLLIKPKDAQTLGEILKIIKGAYPITVLGASSNMIIRDGGIEGIVIRLGRGFSEIEQRDDDKIYAGAFAMDMNVARFAAEKGLSGFEFMIGIPGTIGGGLTMNAGAYGGEFKDRLIEAYGYNLQGDARTLTPDDLEMSYRHTNPPEPMIFTGALFQASGTEDPESLQQKLGAIKAKREETQPVKEKTGGSTFANPTLEECAAAGLPLMKSWQLIQQSGADKITMGDAAMSDLHRNFMINKGAATARDLENLGEAIRTHVHDHFGVMLRWEIKRIGRHLKQ